MSTAHQDCFGAAPTGSDGKPVEDQSQRIKACTFIIDSPYSPSAARILAFRQRAHTYMRKGLYDRAIEDYDAVIGMDSNSRDIAMRALCYSLKGEYDRAIQDYDQAIAMDPNFAVAYNNRAWAYYRSGRGPQGLTDVERSLRLDPRSEHAYDTRAHIRQNEGNTSGALKDYEMSIRLGGERMIKLYQCGLAERGYYKGERDGKDSPELRQAMAKCVQDRECDPLPGDEQCHEAVS
jgi:tetratricopeptide (TPR) repeat protein